MKEYLVNFLLNAVVAYIIATLSFLISNEISVGSAHTAACAGIFGGIAVAVTYQIGRMKEGATINWSTLGVQCLAAVMFGLLGGLQMLAE